MKYVEPYYSLYLSALDIDTLLRRALEALDEGRIVTAANEIRHAQVQAKRLGNYFAPLSTEK